jgi:hypothetical protein
MTVTVDAENSECFSGFLSVFFLNLQDRSIRGIFSVLVVFQEHIWFDSFNNELLIATRSESFASVAVSLFTSL